MARKSDSAIKVEMVGIESVNPYPSNAKTHSPEQVAMLQSSMSQFGFVNPILVDEQGTVIAGHGRLLAAEALGLEEVPVIRLKHLTPEQARALRIADNSIAQSGTGWDVDLLEAELATLRSLDFPLEPLGLDNIELPDIEEVVPAAPRPNRSKTTIFISVKNEELVKARKVIAKALDAAKIGHNL